MLNCATHFVFLYTAYIFKIIVKSSGGLRDFDSTQIDFLSHWNSPRKGKQCVLRIFCWQTYIKNRRNISADILLNRARNRTKRSKILVMAIYYGSAKKSGVSETFLLILNLVSAIDPRINHRNHSLKSWVHLDKKMPDVKGFWSIYHDHILLNSPAWLICFAIEKNSSKFHIKNWISFNLPLKCFQEF